MDLRSRTLPEQTTMNKEPSEDPNCDREIEEAETRESTVLLETEDLDLTIPFDMEESAGFQGVSPGLPRPVSPVRSRERETSPMVRWPMPPRVRGEPVCDFDTTMRGFMGEERFHQMSKPPQENANMDTLPTERTRERQYVGPVHREEQDRMVRTDSGSGAVGGSAIRDPQARIGHGQSRARGYDVDDRGNRPQGFNYDRLLPPGSRYRGRATAHRPAGYHYETPRFEYKIPENLFSEPRPHFPTFSGRHDEWDSFWLKFQLMSRRYDWSEGKQKEQLLFCLKDEAMNYAASLGPEVRDSIALFSQAMADRFSHRTPPETVRASLNNIKKSSKESIQEYASRVRTMMAKAYPDIGCSETFTQMTIHHLLQGLPDQTIAYEVLIRKPKTLTEAVDMITWHECCKETTRKKSGIRQLSSFVNEETQYADETEIRRINGKKFVTEERLIQFGRDLKATIEKLFKEERPGSEQEDHYPYHHAEEPMPRRSGNIICFYCNESGHMSFRCPLRRKHQAEARERDQKKSSNDQKQSENGKGLSQQAGAQTQTQS